MHIPLYHMALYGTAWNYIVSCIVLHVIALYHMVLHGIVLYFTELHGIVGFGARAASRKTPIYFINFIKKTVLLVP